VKNPFNLNKKSPKAKPKVQGRASTAKRTPPALNMRTQEPDAGMDESIYADLQNYDPESMYDYMDAYEYLELDDEEVAAKIEYVVESATSEEEAVAELEEIIEDCDAYIAYFEGIKAMCEAALGYEPSIDDPAANMDVSDLTNPDKKPEDEDKTVDKMKTAKSRRRFAGNRKPVSNDAYINSIPDKDLRESIKTHEREHKKYRDTLIKQIAANKLIPTAELATMSTKTLEGVAQSMRIELPDYGIRGIQANNREEDNGYTALSVNIFKKKGVAENA